MRPVSRAFGFAMKSASLMVDVLTLPTVYLCAKNPCQWLCLVASTAAGIISDVVIPDLTDRGSPFDLCFIFFVFSFQARQV